MKLSMTGLVFLLALAGCSQGETILADAAGDTQSADGTGTVDGTGGDQASDAMPGELPQCTSHEECQERMGDVGPCKLALCDLVSGTCMAGDTKDGTPCDDGDACTLEAFCQGGECLGNGDVKCDDGDPCTLDSCDDEKGCLFKAVDGPACDDGNPCTADDKCGENGCAGTPQECGCETDEDCAQFDDEDLCNGTLSCQEGSCMPKPGSAVQCPGTAGPCAAFACQPESGECLAESLADGIPCTDGDGCTLGDTCQDGACVSGATYVCGDCQETADCAELDSPDKCLGTHVCTDGKCVVDPETIPTKPEITCFAATCDPATGQYVVAQLPNGTFCSDENACTVGDKCTNGTCKGEAAACDDANLCTQDSCDPEVGCLHAPLSDVPCDDGDACTEEDACTDGTCKGAVEVVCDDENPCTDDTCSAEEGCLFEPLSGVACDDGESCTEGDKCEAGECVPGPNVCQCETDADCKQFEDVDLCNGTLHCIDQQCAVDPETVVVCDTSEDPPCKKTKCNPVTGECGQVNSPFGSPCDDGNECTLGETCFSGSCLGGILVNCNDGNPCTKDTCNPDQGCLSEPLDGEECDDGDPCTGGDLCEAGECTPGVNICGCESDAECAQFEDGNLCNGTLWCVEGACKVKAATVITCPAAESVCEQVKCDPPTGECLVTPVKDGTPCDDDDACTDNDLCLEGECQSAPLDCDDDNPCTEDSCDAQEGCQHTPTDGASCDDGNSCTEGDLCEGDLCVPGLNICDCEVDEDCAEKDDGNLCNGVLICVEGACATKPGSVVTCDDGADTECLKNLCAPESGQCALTELADGTVCNDGLVCTELDACLDGACTGSLVDCEDDNPCTDDVCIDQKGGCIHQPNAASCNDGNACTKGDACTNGQCTGKLIICNDSNPCTADSCDPAQGCLFVPSNGPCDDGNACTEADTCSEGECAGAPVSCDDGNPCTDDACDVQLGCLSYDNVEPCDDGDPCTDGDTCEAGDCLGGPPTDCDDGNACTQDSCVSEDGGCQNVALSGTTCDDGDPCTEGDICDDGECVSSKPTDCDDANPCTADACEPGIGCVYDPLSGLSCSDGSACTADDTCVDGQCVGGLISCNDDNPCTEDLCDPSSGCLHPPVAGQPPCDDGNGCTTVDKCQAGKCVGTTPVACNDSNPCTDDSCDPQTGQCVYTANSAPCDDGNPCTEADYCAAKSCHGGSFLNCDDGNPCTDDSCDAAAGGCVHVDNGECQCQSTDDCVDDGNLCNGTPVCQNNVCVTDPSTVVTCPTGNDTACKKNKCQPGTGQCVMTSEPMGKLCNDGSACTTSDHCDGNGSCVGTTISCDDGNVCTTDSCNKTTGCVYLNNALPCDDGDVCTLNDQCGNGSCQGGTPYDCNDDNVCTQDVCVPDETGGPGCTYIPKTGVCNDANACTKNDSCVAGACQGTPITCNDNDPCTANECLPASGCVFPPAPDGTTCSDGEVCTTGDACVEGLCEPGDWLFGCCHTNADCNDSYACTTESCVGGACSWVLQSCDDSNLCTADACEGGLCDHKPLSDEAVVYFEDFDAGTAPGWLFDVLSGKSQEIFWSVDDQASSSPDHSLYAGNPEDHSYDHGDGHALAYSPPLRLPADADIDLSFMVKVGVKEAGCNYDYLKVQVKPAGEPATDLTPRLCDTTEGFVSQSYVLDAYAGKEVRLIFAFITGDAVYNDGEGVYIDDVTVVALPREGCCVFDGDCGDKDLCTGDICDDFQCSNPAVGGTYFQEFFETGAIATTTNPLDSGKWYLSTTGDGEWSVQSERANSTPYAFYAGDAKEFDYDVGAFVASARTPKFSLPTDGAPLLKFDLYTDLHQNDCTNDVFKVGIATSSGAGTVDWLYQKCDSTETFVPVSIDLAAYEGKSMLFLVFQFSANGEKNAAEGVYVDSIRVVKAEDPPSCCVTSGQCNDGDVCTIDWCTGTPLGGVCMDRHVTTWLEDFDDGVAKGWYVTPTGNNNAVTWQVDGYRHKSPSKSFYAGNTGSRSYIGYGAGTTTATTPYFTIDSVSGLNVYLAYHRYLDLCSSSNHCFRTKIQQKYGTAVVLDEVCGSVLGDIDMEKWVFKQFGLDAYQGKEVRFLFELSFDLYSLCNIGKFEGAYIDDVRVDFKGCEP